MVGALIFIATYVLISFRRLGYLPLGRAGGALLGAVACVAFGVIPAAEALGSVDGDTILLLFGMMGIGAFLELDEFPARAVGFVARHVRTRGRLLAFVVWGAGIGSALITNDAMCVLGAPIVVALVRAHDLPATPYLVGLATGANTGSVATLVGNPQNMLCASLGGLGYRDYFVRMLPLSIVALIVNHAVIAWMHRRDLDGELAPPSVRPPLVNRSIALTFAVIFLATGFYLAGFHLAWSAVAGFTALLVAQRKDATLVWPKIEWSVLLFFASLFIVVQGLTRSGATEWFFHQFPLAGGGGLTRLSSIFLLGSNIVSNVPFILVVRSQVDALADPHRGWMLLAMASTFAGNLTLLGSVANVIVAERSREVGGYGFWEYTRLGFPIAIFTTAIGTAWLSIGG